MSIETDTCKIEHLNYKNLFTYTHILHSNNNNNHQHQHPLKNIFKKFHLPKNKKKVSFTKALLLKNIMHELIACLISLL